MTFDQNQRLLRLNSSVAAFVRAPAYRTIGFAARSDVKTWRVIDVIPATCAERAGLRVGDQITACNGLPTDSLSVSKLGIMQDPERPMQLKVVHQGRESSISIMVTTLVP